MTVRQVAQPSSLRHTPQVPPCLLRPRREETQQQVTHYRHCNGSLCALASKKHHKPSSAVLKNSATACPPVSFTHQLPQSSAPSG